MSIDLRKPKWTILTYNEKRFLRGSEKRGLERTNLVKQEVLHEICCATIVLVDNCQPLLIKRLSIPLFPFAEYKSFLNIPKLVRSGFD